MSADGLERTRLCPDCGRVLPVGAFYHLTGVTTRSRCCKECSRARRAETGIAEPDQECTRCGLTLPAGDFPRGPGRVGRRGTCKPCITAGRRARQAAEAAAEADMDAIRAALAWRKPRAVDGEDGWCCTPDLAGRHDRACPARRVVR